MFLLFHVSIKELSIFFMLVHSNVQGRSCLDSMWMIDQSSCDTILSRVVLVSKKFLHLIKLTCPLLIHMNGVTYFAVMLFISLIV